MTMTAPRPLRSGRSSPTERAGQLFGYIVSALLALIVLGVLVRVALLVWTGR